jgi:O-methyltransferase
VARAGYRIQPRYPADFDGPLIETIERVAPYTQTTPEGIAATCHATEYVVDNGIVGACVECGVWKGGSMMAIALTLLRLGETARDLYLFDTFAGMPEPGEADVTLTGASATGEWRRNRRGDVNDWNYVSLDDVRDTLLATGYPGERIHFVKGRVEETLPAEAPAEISLLRLDTDWYESTRQELANLFPRLSRGGVLIVDDYGFWQGARKATDEYFASQQIPIMLSRVDVGARIAVKQD